MPAIASLEDLKAAKKDLLEAKDLNELETVFKKWRRIGWKNVCGASMGKVRDIQKPNGRRHPGQHRMDFSAGASCGYRNVLQKNQKVRVEFISVGWDEVAFDPTSP